MHLTAFPDVKPTTVLSIERVDEIFTSHDEHLGGSGRCFVLAQRSVVSHTSGLFFDSQAESVHRSEAQRWRQTFSGVLARHRLR